jgi:hypothetical protein
MTKKIIKKKKPTITGLTRELRATKKHSQVLKDEVNELRDQVQTKELERETLCIELNKVNIEAAKQGNELSETKMWFGKAQQTIIELNETIAKLNLTIEEHNSAITQGLLIPKEKAMRFFLINEKTLRYGSGELKDMVGDKNIGVREITMDQAIRFNSDMFETLYKERNTINNYENLFHDGKVVFATHAEQYINRSKTILYMLKHLFKRKQTLREYAIEHNKI